ncbi:hypothetical protein ACTSKR_15545 [Chitinibacteraceae bacterium HSL-7]
MKWRLPSAALRREMLLIAALATVTVGIALSASQWQQGTDMQRMNSENHKLSASRTLTDLRDTQRRLDEYLKRQHLLAARGALAPADRVAWVEQLTLTQNRFPNAGLDYRILPQRQLSDEGPLVILATPMLVGFSARHEGELQQIVESLESAPGFPVEASCTLERVQNANETWPLLRAECAIWWLNMVEPGGST